MAETPNRSGPTAIGTGATQLYIAGAGGTWSILRDIIVANEDQFADHYVTVGVNTSVADAAGKRCFGYKMRVPAGQTLPVLRGAFQVLLGHATTPDLVYALADAASVLTARVSAVDGP